MNEEPTDVESIVDSMARIVGVSMSDESRAAVVTHLAIAFRMAPVVMDFPMPDEAEPAPVFTP